VITIKYDQAGAIVTTSMRNKRRNHYIGDQI